MEEVEDANWLRTRMFLLLGDLEDAPTLFDAVVARRQLNDTWKRLDAELKRGEFLPDAWRNAVPNVTSETTDLIRVPEEIEK